MYFVYTHTETDKHVEPLIGSTQFPPHFCALRSQLNNFFLIWPLVLPSDLLFILKGHFVRFSLFVYRLSTNS